MRTAAAASFSSRTRNDVKTVRKARLSLYLSHRTALSFSLLPWQQLPLPARVGLAVFIQFCVLTEELRNVVFTLPYKGFYEQWAQGFPQSQINTINGVHTHTHNTHTALCHTPYQAFQTAPIFLQLSLLSELTMCCSHVGKRQ